MARAVRLNRLSVGWNVVEAVVALVAGMAAASISLVGFGLDSTIEVSASVVLAWRLHQERKSGCRADDDRRATRVIAASFAALAAYVWVQASVDLLQRNGPEASPVGITLTSLSLLVMPWLARAKRRLAPVLGSRAAVAEANQTALCAVLSGVVLLGLGLNAAVGWWWADPVAGLVVGVLAAVEAVRTWRAEALAHTCCG